MSQHLRQSEQYSLTLALACEPAEVCCCCPRLGGVLFTAWPAKYRVDALIHFAAFKAVEESIRKPLDYYRNNLDGTVAIGQMMIKHGVHVSSSFT
jgi:nucleoside-diphosphate-sugar epimerase